MTDLEQRLRVELAADAEHAQIVAPEWDETALTPLVTDCVPRRVPQLLTAAAVAAVLVGGLIAVGVRREPEPAATFEPTGEEFPLTTIGLDALPEYNAGPAEEPGSDLANPSVNTVVIVPGRNSWIVSFESPYYDAFSGTVERFRCVNEFLPDGGASGGCSRPVGVIDFGPWSDAAARDTHVAWTSVPSGAAFVAYVDGSGRQRWQRPVDQMAFFPESGPRGTMTAYGSGGEVLHIVDDAAVEQSIIDTYGPYPIAPDMDSLTNEQRAALHVMAKDRTRTCLDAAGATYPYGSMFPRLPATSPPTTWDDCVAEAKRAVDEQFAEWGGALVPQQLPPEATVGPAAVTVP